MIEDPDLNRKLVPIVGALTLIVGFAVAQSTGSRALGGAVLVAGAAWCVRAWWRTPGPLRALGAAAVFAVAFAVSHPLGHAVGAWPSVLVVSVVAAALAWMIGGAGTSPHD